MNQRTLDAPPPLGRLFVQAGLGTLPLISRLPLSGLPLVGAAAGTRRSDELPDTALRLEVTQIDRERLTRYSRVCGFGLRDRPPVTFTHILAFPLQLALMTDPAFPFPAIGLVHIENEITQHRPIEPGEALSLTVWTQDLRPHPRGLQFALRSEARVGAELVWEETSTNLRRGRTDEGSQEERSAGTDRLPPEAQAGPELRETAVWRLPGDLGRRYGAVAGDLNPIHLHPLSARLFGFPRAIAHGMWTKARCLAALEPRLPEAVRVRVSFRRPILLPGEVVFLTGVDQAGTTSFAVRGKHRDELHLEGELARL